MTASYARLTLGSARAVPHARAPGRHRIAARARGRALPDPPSEPHSRHVSVTCRGARGPAWRNGFGAANLALNAAKHAAGRNVTIARGPAAADAYAGSFAL